MILPGLAVLLALSPSAKADDGTGAAPTQNSEVRLLRQEMSELETKISGIQQKLDSLSTRASDTGSVLTTNDQLNSGNTAGAAQNLANALNNPNPFVQGAAYNEMSRYYMMTGQPTQALQAAQQSAGLNPAYGEAYTNMAAAQMALGDNAGARQSAQQALAIWPNHAVSQKLADGLDHLAEQGSLVAGQGNTMGAAGSWLNGGAGPGGSAGGRNPMAGRAAPAPPGGASDAPAALRGDGPMSNGQAGADARGLLQIGDVKAAMEAAQRAIAANANDGDAHAILAKAQNIQGNYQEAVQEATKALEAGNNVDALNARSYAHNNLGEPKSALMDADTAISLAPGDALAHLNRGQALESLGQLEPAMKDYKRAAKLNPAFKKVFEQAYARNARALGLPEGNPSGLGRALSAASEHMGVVGALSGAGLMGLIALNFAPKKPNTKSTTGVLKAIGTTAAGKVTPNGTHRNRTEPGERRGRS